jgi:SAM-dependent methyltransferase
VSGRSLLTTAFRRAKTALSPGSAPGSLEELTARKAEIEAAHGPWTAVNCQLAEGLTTLQPGSVNFDEKTRRCVRIVQDFLGDDLRGLRVLDLGAGEGGLSLEFAARGASVVCVEGRRLNVAKAEFAASALGLDVDFRCQDVRELREDERYDVTLCFGLLYHLDGESAVRLVETIGRITVRLLVLDTHFSLSASEALQVNGNEYRGHTFAEHEPAASLDAKAAKPWASLGNDSSFWLSKPSLFNLLLRSGFSTAYEVAAPLVYDYWDRGTGERFRYRDRTTIAAAKSAGRPMLTTPAVNAVSDRFVPEDLERRMIEYPTPPKR